MKHVFAVYFAFLALVNVHTVTVNYTNLAQNGVHPFTVALLVVSAATAVVCFIAAIVYASKKED